MHTTLKHKTHEKNRLTYKQTYIIIFVFLVSIHLAMEVQIYPLRHSLSDSLGYL